MVKDKSCMHFQVIYFEDKIGIFVFIKNSHSGPCVHASLIAVAPGGGQVSTSVHTQETSVIKGSTIHSMLREEKRDS